ncbi:MAG TPA: Lrp/AsnC family transcriptional regulator [Chromatiales bacterium]|nr:Lrp/AsnC family transcriptional regulator [Thiotrichales bacterium]HIP69508.1 Lrp/AsnC family transcriptional regulator [Chromatiales bacterium]
MLKLTIQKETNQVAVSELTDLERRFLNAYQHEFPLSPMPYADIADELGVTETKILEMLDSLSRRKILSRIGPVFTPNRAGASTLVAMAVPAEQLEEVAALVNSYDEVNHNYERLNDFNLWFVLTASDRNRIEEIIQELRDKTGFQILNLPLEQAYHIDLGFPLWC